MALRSARRTGRTRPKVRVRTVLFGALLCAFGVTMLVIGLGIGVTKAGLPDEHHPSLLVDRADIREVRGLLDENPHRVWRDRLLDFASIDQEFSFDPQSGAVNAQKVKAFAFAAALTGDRKYAEKACEILRHARPPSRGGRWRGLDDIVEGAAAYAIAYDLLAGYLRSDTVLEARTRLMVTDLADELYRSRYTWPSPCGDTRTIKQFAALGLCALSVRDYEPERGQAGPRQWYRRARREVLDALRNQVCRDGAYAEGPGDHFDAARLYVPFLVANLRVTGEDLLDDQALKACEWSVKIRMPNGMRPNIDNSGLTPSCSYAVAAEVPESDLFQWDAQNSDLGAVVPVTQLPEALSWYRTADKAKPPKLNPSTVLDGSGDIVFRSGWGADDSYMLLRAERAKARTAGHASEQPDETSIILCQAGETLVLDSGYGGWSRRAETRDATKHNMVLVDGEGPPITTALGAIISVGVDVDTRTAVFDKEVDAATVRIRHNGAAVDRTVIFAGKRDYIIFDRARADEGNHDFQWLLHVNAGGTTGGGLSIDGNRAVVTRHHARLQAVVHSSQSRPTRLATSLETHYFEEGRPAKHVLLQAAASHTRHAQFLAVLSPVSGRERFPDVSVTQQGDCVRADIGENRHVLARTVGYSPMATDGLSTDGYALYWLDGKSATPGCVMALGATSISLNGVVVWRSEERSSVVWRPGNKPDRLASQQG